MTDTAFLLEHNARHLWHPMAHSAEMRATPPKIFVEAEGVELLDAEGNPIPEVDEETIASWGKVGRNAPCPCGSGLKYKHCHGRFA